MEYSMLKNLNCDHALCSFCCFDKISSLISSGYQTVYMNIAKKSTFS